MSAFLWPHIREHDGRLELCVWNIGLGSLHVTPVTPVQVAALAMQCGRVLYGALDGATGVTERATDPPPLD